MILTKNSDRDVNTLKKRKALSKKVIPRKRTKKEKEDLITVFQNAEEENYILFGKIIEEQRKLDIEENKKSQNIF